MFEPICVPRRTLYTSPEQDKPFDEENCNLRDVKACRSLLERHKDYLADRFCTGCEIGALLRCRSDFMDSVLLRLYRSFGLDLEGDLALVAVGGYGRRELFLGSDVDLFVICNNPQDPLLQERISSFISYLWDIKLHLGSAVRSVSQTIVEAAADITVRTNLLETHLIAGNAAVYEDLLRTLEEHDSWSAEKFFQAKLAEQVQRHHQFRDTIYAIEPDLKNSPGGLRDLQTVQWVATLHLKVHSPEDFSRANLLSESEYLGFKEARDFLFQLRYALHCFSEHDRLSLDLQKEVAALLGYDPKEGNKSVETMMRALYRICRRVSSYNYVMLQVLGIDIGGNCAAGGEPVFLNDFFVRRGQYLDIIDPELFRNDPTKIISLFATIAATPEVHELHSNCLRALRESRDELEYYLVESAQCRQLFKQLLLNPADVQRALPAMHRTRVLSAYLPQWQRIEGLTQFDMFHLYTVDEHTIRALSSIDELTKSKDPRFAQFRKVHQLLGEPGLLLTAVFLHDIAKGRNGHHAVFGAQEAANFCQLHAFAPYQTELISWAVAHHLDFATTATRRDLSDPEVIEKFAALVEDEEHLNLLYCLTVVDINATNEHEWSSWKDSIFKQLYLATLTLLHEGGESRHNHTLRAKEKQQQVLERCPGLGQKQLQSFFDRLPVRYFLHYSADDIIWHVRNILRYHHPERPLILFSQQDQIGTELLLWNQRSVPGFFGCVATAMTLRKLNVLSAQVFLSADGHQLCTIKFQTPKGANLDSDRLHSLRVSILEVLHHGASLQDIPAPNKPNVFGIPTTVTFNDASSSNYTSVEISTLDTRGLLAKIGITLGQCGCLISAARITTTGERADDYFAITDVKGKPLNSRKKEQLYLRLCEALGSTPHNLGHLGTTL